MTYSSCDVTTPLDLQTVILDAPLAPERGQGASVPPVLPHLRGGVESPSGASGPPSLRRSLSLSSSSSQAMVPLRPSVPLRRVEPLPCKRLLQRDELQHLPMLKPLYTKKELDTLVSLDDTLQQKREEWERRTAGHRKQLEQQSRRVSEVGFFVGLHYVRAVIDLISREKVTYLERLEGDIIRLAREVAEQIIGHELTQEPQTSERILRNALKQLHGTYHLVIGCSSHDLPTLQAKLDQLRDEFSLDSIRLQEDSNLSQGNYAIVANHQLIHAQVEQQLNTIMNELLTNLSFDEEEG